MPGMARAAVWCPGSAPGLPSESAGRPRPVPFSASSPGVVYVLHVICDPFTFQMMESLRLRRMTHLFPLAT